jgi:hypothetical protein
MARGSSITPEVLSEIEASSDALNVSAPFTEFQGLMRTHRSHVLAITDFCLLYSGLILLLCEGNNQEHPLSFLQQFLALGIPERPSECAILFAILIRQGGAARNIRRSAVDVLAQLADINDEIYARTEAGAAHHDALLSQLCRDALDRTTARPGALSPPRPREFADIPADAPPEMAAAMIWTSYEAMEAGTPPPDPVSLVRNIVNTMRRNSGCTPVIENGAFCLKTLFGLCGMLPVESIADILEWSFSVLSGDSFFGGPDSFDAVEAVRDLSNEVFDQVTPEVLIAAAAFTIARTAESHLPLLMSRLREYCKFSGQMVDASLQEEIQLALRTYHPTFSEWSDSSGGHTLTYSVIDEIQLSTERLMDAETALEELEAIIAKDDSRVIAQYPLYLRGFLQRAFVLFTEVEPIGMTDPERENVEAMLESACNWSPEDLEPGGAFHIETLAKEFASICMDGSP